jgi:competence protein ComEC
LAEGAREHNRLLKPVYSTLDLALASLTASLATAPFSLYQFGMASISGVAANMLVMPLTGFITMPSGVIAMLAMPLGLEAWPLKVMGASLRGMMIIAEQVNTKLGWVIHGVAPSQWVVVAAAVAGLWLVLARGWKRWVGVPLAIAVWGASVWMHHVPVILMEEEYTAIALPDGRWILDGPKKGNWATEQWQDRLGVTFILKDEAIAQGLMQCDGLGCTVRGKAGVTALPKTPEAVEEDCAVAEVIVWRGELEDGSCAAYLVAGSADRLRREGPWVVYDAPWKVKVMGEEGGKRPWRIKDPYK